MPYMTRNGTRVLHPLAARKAITAEIYRDAAEYRTYKRFSLRGVTFAEEGDNLLISNIDEPNIPALAGMAHVLNLTGGDSQIISWDTLAHNIKPVSA